MFIIKKIKILLVLSNFISCCKASEYDRYKLLEAARKEQTADNKMLVNSHVGEEKHYVSDIKIQNGVQMIRERFRFGHRQKRSLDIDKETINGGKTGNDDEIRLVKHLFSDYDREVRPVIKKSDVVEVVFDLAYAQLVDLDEKNQVLVSNVWVRMSWYNKLLIWDKNIFGGIESINIDPSLIWLPDIVLYNNAEETLGSGQVDQFKTKVIINHDGRNKWYAPTILKSRCGISVEYFPFDDQKCDLTFLSWTYDGFRVKISNKSDKADIASYSKSGEFKLLSVNAYYKEVIFGCCPEPYPQVTYTIHMRRKTLFYFNNLIVPCFLITTLGLLTFVLPPATGERVTLVITTLLAMTVFMLMIAEKTPTTSKATPLIGKFFIASMVIIGMSLIATCITLNLYECSRTIDSVPRFVRVLFLNYLSPALRVDPPRSLVLAPPPAMFDDNDNDEEDEKVVERQTLRGRSWNFHKANSNESNETLPRKVPTLSKELTQGIAILSERARHQNQQEAIAEEWHAVAKVADRLFLIVFLSIIAFTSIYMFAKRPCQNV